MYGLKKDWVLEKQPRVCVLEDYQGGEARWCPGCGDHAVLNSVQRVARDEASALVGVVRPRVRYGVPAEVNADRRDRTTTVVRQPASAVADATCDVEQPPRAGMGSGERIPLHMEPQRLLSRDVACLNPLGHQAFEDVGIVGHGL